MIGGGGGGDGGGGGGGGDVGVGGRGTVPPIPRRHGGEVRPGLRRLAPAGPGTRHPGREQLPGRQGARSLRPRPRPGPSGSGPLGGELIGEIHEPAALGVRCPRAGWHVRSCGRSGWPTAGPAVQGWEAGGNGLTEYY